MNLTLNGISLTGSVVAEISGAGEEVTKVLFFTVSMPDAFLEQLKGLKEAVENRLSIPVELGFEMPTHNSFNGSKECVKMSFQIPENLISTLTATK